jgi:hypothetical protein
MGWNRRRRRAASGPSPGWRAKTEKIASKSDFFGAVDSARVLNYRMTQSSMNFISVKEKSQVF